MDLELVLILVFIFVGLFFFVSFGILGMIAIIKELRGKEVKRDEAKKAESKTDLARYEQRNDE